jgi:hypothetical protein
MSCVNGMSTKRGITGVGGLVGEHHLHRLGQHVQVPGAAEAHALHVEAFHDVQELDHVRPAGRWRRCGYDLVAAITADQRLLWLRTVRPHVVQRHHAAQLLQFGHDGLRHLAFVEDGRPARGDLFQCDGQVLVAQDLARFQRQAVGQVDIGRRRRFRQLVDVVQDHAAEQRADLDALAAQPDRRLEHFRQRHGAVLLERHRSARH